MSRHTQEMRDADEVLDRMQPSQRSEWSVGDSFDPWELAQKLDKLAADTARRGRYDDAGLIVCAATMIRMLEDKP